MVCGLSGIAGQAMATAGPCCSCTEADRRATRGHEPASGWRRPAGPRSRWTRAVTATAAGTREGITRSTRLPAISSRSSRPSIGRRPWSAPRWAACTALLAAGEHPGLARGARACRRRRGDRARGSHPDPLLHDSAQRRLRLVGRGRRRDRCLQPAAPPPAQPRRAAQERPPARGRTVVLALGPGVHAPRR